MAEIVKVAARVARVYPENDECYNVRLNATVLRGQALYQVTTGLFGLADASEIVKAQFRGVAMDPGNAGDAITMLKKGFLAGYTLGTTEDEVYSSDTEGAFDTASGTILVKCGRVCVLPDRALTQVLWINADWRHEWGSADYDA